MSYNKQTKQPQVALSYALLLSTISTVVTYWSKTKIYSTKADRQDLLIKYSDKAYRSLINTKYQIDGKSTKLEDVYGTEFARDVIDDVIQELLTGLPVHTPVVEADGDAS